MIVGHNFILCEGLGRCFTAKPNIEVRMLGTFINYYCLLGNEYLKVHSKSAIVIVHGKTKHSSFEVEIFQGLCLFDASPTSHPLLESALYEHKRSSLPCCFLPPPSAAS